MTTYFKQNLETQLANLKMQFFIILPFLVIQALSSHVDRNNTDVIVTFEGHNEANRVIPETVHLIDDKETGEGKNEEGKLEEGKIEEGKIEEGNIEEVTESDVVFVPNEKEVLRNQDYAGSVKELVQATNINGILKNAKVETETPSQDIIFISGRNDENVEKSIQKDELHQKKPSDKTRRIKLDCKNLDCNNTANYICGGKIEENNKWKYRVFLNDCYFRKVNCAFKYANNRYKTVSMEYCKDIGGRYFNRRYMPGLPSQTLVKTNETRRSFASRRTLNMGVDGAFCSHFCPDHCTEEYDPQCAVSAAGKRRMFLNHCKLDYTSCLFQEVWHRWPLSECVGGRKADMRQNRGFIGWLQRVGIVDKRGKLVLS